MRPFRGMTKDGKLVYGSHVQLATRHYIIPNAVDARWIEVLPETVCQQTGLKDKKGKDGYFGDKVKHDNGDIGFIEWDEGRCGVCFNWPHSLYDTKSYPISNADYIDFEIIGTIHDKE